MDLQIFEVIWVLHTLVSWKERIVTNLWDLENIVLLIKYFHFPATVLVMPISLRVTFIKVAKVIIPFAQSLLLTLLHSHRIAAKMLFDSAHSCQLSAHERKTTVQRNQGKPKALNFSSTISFYVDVKPLHLCGTEKPNPHRPETLDLHANDLPCPEAHGQTNRRNQKSSNPSTHFHPVPLSILRISAKHQMKKKRLDSLFSSNAGIYVPQEGLSHLNPSPTAI